MSLTIKQFRTFKWDLVFSYGDTNKGFKVYGCGVKDITITHDYKKGKVAKITYRVAKRTTESPTQAVKFYNAVQRGRTQAPGSPESIAARKVAVY